MGLFTRQGRKWKCGHEIERPLMPLTFTFRAGASEITVVRKDIMDAALKRNRPEETNCLSCRR
ncbi:MAG: hypothetical protein CL565_03225 [Alphaproteobacteria bacterium]|nr:hypothetical protein [Alphaproteobacteria bacterium]